MTDPIAQSDAPSAAEGYRVESRQRGSETWSVVIRASDGYELFADGGEPEDQILSRDLKVFVDELNTAALRTAQLEDRFSKTRLSELRLKARAETAESALVDAKKLAIQDAIEMLKVRSCACSTALRALLTVAAEPPKKEKL